MVSFQGARRIFLVVPVSLLAACAQNPGPSTVSGASSPAAATAGQDQSTQPAANSATDHNDALPDAAHITEPSRLKGLTVVQVQEVLGQPGFQRRDAPAEIWQYRGRGCTLDLFIYDYGNSRTVDHWSVRSPSRVPDVECFQQLVEQGSHSQPGS
jgi:hypothetical protein